MKRFLLLVIILLALFGPPFRLFWLGYSYVISSHSDASIDIFQDPYLTDVPEGMEPIRLVTKHHDVLLTPRYRYTLAGRVIFSVDTRDLATRLLSFEALDNEYIPIDLLIFWDGLAPYYYAITSSHYGTQFVREARWSIDHDEIIKREKLDPKKDKATIIEMFRGMESCCGSHNHIIPANEHILTALKYLAKKGKDVKLEGYLVDIHRTRRDKPEWAPMEWTTSTVPEDSACETFYVDRIQVGSRLFQ